MKCTPKFALSSLMTRAHWVLARASCPIGFQATSALGSRAVNSISLQAGGLWQRHRNKVGRSRGGGPQEPDAISVTQLPKKQVRHKEQDVRKIVDTKKRLTAKLRNQHRVGVPIGVKF